MSCSDLFRVDATLVANEFLDKYMPSANGDYVKVYLYLLRNRDNGSDIETIADSLQLTEGDVRRAVKYWEKCGILSMAEEHNKHVDTADSLRALTSAAMTGTAETAAADSDAAAVRPRSAKAAGVSAADQETELRSRYRRTEGKAVLERLSSDEEFRQLLFMVQKYRSKILTESEEQVLAYLYDGLKLPFDVLDYLVQYCVGNGHSSMRYIEKTGLDWASSGIDSLDAAKRRTREFERAKEKTPKRTVQGKSTNGMTRDNMDLDSWLSDVVQRNIR